jgi:YHS domain-containing protein
MRGIWIRMCAIRILVAGIAVAGAPGVAQSQQPAAPPPHDGHETVEASHEEHVGTMTGALGITRARAGSGTAWLPDVTPMYAVHRDFGGWSAMLHENLFLQYVNEGTDRGGDQLGSVNWMMGMAERRAAGGFLGVRTMFSLERLTVGECGYPDLLATGESCNGRPIHDRQHPHDFFMELAGTYERELSGALAVQLYAGLAGEPALGPVAFPHRISALSTPIAPLTHHWLDSTHISYGVASAGVFGTRWKVEASAFNGREPDENRFDLDLGALDSFSGRLWFAPSDRWSVQISKGRLKEAEAVASGGPRRDVDRTTASATYHQLVRTAGFWSVTGAWGRNAEDDHATDALLVETDLALDARNTLFARAEGAGKTAEELILPELGHDPVTVAKLHVGYTRRLPGSGMFERRVGGALSFSAIPARAQQAYGRGSRLGILVFFSVRPGATVVNPGARASAVPRPEAPVAADPHAGHVMPAETGRAAAPPEPATAPGTPTPSSPAMPAAAAPAADPHAGHVMPAETARPAAPPEPATAPGTPTPRLPAASAAAPPAVANPHAGHVAPAPRQQTAPPQQAPKPEATAPQARTTPDNPAARLADLTCQPRVDPDTAPRATYLGKAYYFCTAADRDLFLKAPGK